MINWDTLTYEMQKNSTKIPHFLIGLSICFLLIWVVVVYQMDSPSTPNIRVDQSGRLDSLKLHLGANSDMSTTKTDESNLTLSSTSSASSSSIPNSTNGVIFPGLLLMLVTVTGLWWWIKKKTKDGKWGTTSSGSLFKIVASQELELGQKLMLLEMNEEYWLLAVGTHQTNVLHHCNKDEWNGLAQHSNLKEDAGARAGADSHSNSHSHSHSHSHPKQFKNSYISFLDVLRKYGQKNGSGNN